MYLLLINFNYIIFILNLEYESLQNIYERNEISFNSVFNVTLKEIKTVTQTDIYILIIIITIIIKMIIIKIIIYP